MPIESCENVKTVVGNTFVCSPFEKTAQLCVDSMFRYPFGCPAKFQREESMDCDGLSDCTVVHCVSECVAPDGFIANIHDCVDAIYVRESEIGRPARGDRFWLKGQRFRVDAVTGCCGYTWRTVVTEESEDCESGGCAGLFN